MPTIREVVQVDKPLGEAYADAQRALETIGGVREADLETGRLSGTTRYGFQKVRLDIALAESDGGTQVTVVGSGDDAAGVGARDGVVRLLKALHDPASMPPDAATTKRGVTTSQTLRALWPVALFVLVLVLVLLGWYGLAR